MPNGLRLSGCLFAWRAVALAAVVLVAGGCGAGGLDPIVDTETPSDAPLGTPTDSTPAGSPPTPRPHTPPPTTPPRRSAPSAPPPPPHPRLRRRGVPAPKPASRSGFSWVTTISLGRSGRLLS